MPAHCLSLHQRGPKVLGLKCSTPNANEASVPRHDYAKPRNPSIVSQSAAWNATCTRASIEHDHVIKGHEKDEPDRFHQLLVGSAFLRSLIATTHTDALLSEQ